MMSETREPTSKQCWAVFTLIGYDIRNSDLNFEEASDIIGAFKGTSDEDFDLDELIKIVEESGGIKKKDTKTEQNKNWKSILDKAIEAGEKAVNDCTPTPMTVIERENPLDDSSPIIKQYEPISDGVCGFASVILKPGNHKFVNWLKKEYASTESINKLYDVEGMYLGKHYRGGYSLSVMNYNQSYEKKSAFARAFSDVVNQEIDDSKFQSYIESRLD